MVDDIFDETRKVISKHISNGVTNEVLKQRDSEYRSKVHEVLDKVLADPAFLLKLEKAIKAAINSHVYDYFDSDDFRRRCVAHAKGMLKNG